MSRRAASPPVNALVAIEEALVDQVPPQRCVVLVQAPQLEVDLTFRVTHAGLELLGNVVGTSRLDRFAGIVTIRPSRMNVLSTASRSGGNALSFRLPEHAA